MAIDVAIKEFESKLREVFDRTGLKGLNEHITSELNRWKNERITIAVTGNSSAGKSSLINALRGLDQSEENAAKEGVTETTTERRAYSLPSNEKIILYDLPGAGTRSHPIESYARDMDFKQYDFFVIVSAHRFMETDAAIVKEIQRLKKQFFLVRSNIEYNVNNQKKTQSRAVVLETIRKDCFSNLHELNVKANDVFLVDSHVYYDFELGKLQMSIANNAPEALKASLILSYRNMSKEVIEGKIQCFKNRTMYVATKAVVSAFPGAGLLMKVSVITDEINFYKEDLGLDDASLVRTSAILGIDLTEIKNMITITDSDSFQIKLIEMFKDDRLELQRLCLGFIYIGVKITLAALRKSFEKVHNILCKIIETLRLEALQIREHIIEENTTVTSTV